MIFRALLLPLASTKNHISDKTLGGGTALLILDSISIILNPSHNYTAFECSSVTLKLHSSTLTVFDIYRPPTSSKYSQPISVFLDQFQTFLSSAATTPHEFIITGDINIHLDDPLDSSSQQFTDLLSSTNVTQHVSVTTHIHNHSLDLVITFSRTNLSPTILQSDFTVSDHFPIFTHHNLTPTPPPPPSNLPSVAPKTLISSNSIMTSLHPPYSALSYITTWTTR